MAQQKPVKKTKKSSNPADSYPPMKDKRGVPTIGGGEGTTPPFTKAEMEYKKKMTGLPKGKMGKTISKAKNGKSFDLNKDGKTTFKDVLIGRGVLPKTAKSGAKMKMGGKTPKKAMNGYGGKAASMIPPKKAAIGALLPLAMKALPMLGGLIGGKKKKNGGSMKKCRYGCK